MTTLTLHRTASPNAGPTPAAPAPSRPARGTSVLRRAAALLLVPGEGQESEVPALHAADAQRMLSDVGLLPDVAVTGRWNPATAEAVRDFQLARGLAPSGVADRRTADALLAA